jgi:hypothetical protein
MSTTRDEWVRWIQEKIPDPTAMITLTYEFERHPQHALENLKGLVQMLNVGQLGKDYQRRVKHSYFSYVFVLEYQRRGVVHWHGIVGSWVDWKAIHQWWQKSCGWAWIARIDDPNNFRSGGNKVGAYRYLAKYLTKGGEDAEVWFSEKIWERTSSGLIEVRSEDLGDNVKAVERSVP